ncbi:MAG: hypothetical protein RIS61_557, partial [Actinomycetota bacterium]
KNPIELGFLIPPAMERPWPISPQEVGIKYA